ncbi:MAG: hypothetical protein AAF804_01970 [Bacteroidota bacterium]
MEDIRILIAEDNLGNTRLPADGFQSGVPIPPMYGLEVWKS